MNTDNTTTMSTTLQELTQKIYQDGVAKGQTDAEAIIAQAEEKASQIIAQANTQAEKIVTEAEIKAKQTKNTMQSELQLYTKQTVAALQTEIANLLTGKIASSTVKAAVAEKDFMSKMILELVKSWATNNKLSIKTADADKLTQYFEANAKELLNNKVTIEQVNGLKTKFEIQPEGEGYKLVFGEDELIAYFKEFLRPQLIKTLFA